MALTQQLESISAYGAPVQRQKSVIFQVSCKAKHTDFLIDNIYVRFGSSVFRQVIGIPMGTNSAPLLADLFLHTFEYDFMVKTMKQDITKAIQFSNTFRYIDDLFSANNVDFGNYISAIYLSELELKDNSTSSTEVCYLDTNIKTRSWKQKLTRLVFLSNFMKFSVMMDHHKPKGQD